MNLDRISEELQNYTGQEESMQAVVGVLQEELGENWTQTVFTDLESLPSSLKENLTHAFNYYAATMAWNEIQEYLADEELKNTPELQERLPILEHWLDFFGAPGQGAYQQLTDKLSTMPLEETAESQNEEDEQSTASEENADAPEASDEETSQDVSSEEKNEASETEATTEQEASPEVFEIQKIERQLELLNQAQAWLAARCIELNEIEIYAYPFYGFIVDLMRQVLKGMNAIEKNPDVLDQVETAFAGGKTAFDNRKQAIEHDIELAEQNCESAVTALISEDTDMDEVKRTLGTIDNSEGVEYVGPPPDGFEPLDDQTPLDAAAIKQQYEKLEQAEVMREVKSSTSEENTSQNDQKGVQRKLSFSLKKKKPTEDAT